MLVEALRAMHQWPRQPGIQYTSLFAALLLAVLTVGSAPAYSQNPKTVLVAEINVVDETGRGVPSEIRRVDDNDKNTHFAYTNKRGIAKPGRDCAVNHRLMAIPKVKIYTPKNDELDYCQKIVRIELILTQVTLYLFKQAELAEAEQEYGVATMLYSEVAWRARKTDQKIVIQATVKAYANLGMRLKVTNPMVFDAKQKKYVLTQNTVDKLRAFQSQQGLAVSGRLDAATQEAISGRPVWQFIQTSYKAAYKKMGVR